MAINRTFSRETSRAEAVQPPATSPICPPTSETTLTTSVISNDLAILGQGVTILTKGALQVDGQLQANVHGVEILIGQKGQVEGTLVAESVCIEGEVNGTIRALRVELTPTAKVEGEIHHQVLVVAEGSTFEGSVRRPKDRQELMPVLDRAAHESSRARQTP
jgi:cytoskeletal protein CcmA (bactofilin family)